MLFFIGEVYGGVKSIKLEVDRKFRLPMPCYDSHSHETNKKKNSTPCLVK